jgi:hypothetical protein
MTNRPPDYSDVELNQALCLQSKLETVQIAGFDLTALVPGVSSEPHPFMFMLADLHRFVGSKAGLSRARASHRPRTVPSRPGTRPHPAYPFHPDFARIVGL